MKRGRRRFVQITFSQRFLRCDSLRPRWQSLKGAAAKCGSLWFWEQRFLSPGANTSALLESHRVDSFSFLFFVFFREVYLRIFLFFCYVILQHHSTFNLAAPNWQLQILFRWRFYINTHDFIKTQSSVSDVGVVRRFFPKQRWEKNPKYEFKFWLPSFINHLMTPSNLSCGPSEGLEPDVGNLWNEPNWG